VSEAEVKLMQVTRDGKLRMRILAPMLSSQIVKRFNNESVRIELVKEDGPQRVGFKIENRDTDKNIIQMRLTFKNPKMVSIDTVIKIN
jgi:hypothetical protein